MLCFSSLSYYYLRISLNLFSIFFLSKSKNLSTLVIYISELLNITFVYLTFSGLLANSFIINYERLSSRSHKNSGNSYLFTSVVMISLINFIIGYFHIDPHAILSYILFMNVRINVSIS